MPDPKDKEHLIDHFSAHNTISGKYQHEMAVAILKEPGFAEKLEKQSRLSEEAAFQILLNAMRGLLVVLPLAQLHRINVSCWLMKLHSDLTGDPTMREVFEAVNERVFDQDQS